MATLVRSVAQSGSEPLGVISEIGPVFKDCEQVLCSLDVLDKQRVLADETHHSSSQLTLTLTHSLCSTCISRLTAPDTELFLARRLAIASWARNRSDRVGFRITHVESVDASEFVVSSVDENRDVPSSNSTPSGPTVMVLERRLINTSTREEASRRLSEVRQRNRFVDLGVFRDALEHLRKRVIAHRFGCVQLAPQRRRRIVRIGMVLQPALQVWNTRNQRHRPLAHLSINGDLQSVLMVCDVPDAQIAQLATSGTGIPGDGDQCCIAGVLRRLNHGLDVLLPVQHVPRLRSGVIVTARPGRDPVDGIGWFITVFVASTSTEDAQRDTIVSVGLFVVVRSIDPADDHLGSTSFSQRSSETVGFFSDEGTVSEEFFVAVGTVPRFEKEQLVREGEECFSIIIDDVVRFFDSRSQSVDELPRIGHGGPETLLRIILSDMDKEYKSGPWLLPKTLESELLLFFLISHQ